MLFNLSLTNLEKNNGTKKQIDYGKSKRLVHKLIGGQTVTDSIDN